MYFKVYSIFTVTVQPPYLRQTLGGEFVPKFGKGLNGYVSDLGFIQIGVFSSFIVAKNRLAQETSPYLLQHADNPVDWYAWGSEALQRAIAECKPIFLSVGYSSCHWCHVMAHESFENDDIAEFMNENFINIKVDREERPDIDDIYQKACQMATGQGGWPLSVFLTPDQKPFHVGTYYPPLDSYGRPGFGSLCRQLAQAWREKQDDVKSRADDFVNTMKKAERIHDTPKTTDIESQTLLSSQQPRKELGFDKITFDEAAMNLYDNGDSTYGGFGSAPKFPNTACVSFLLYYAKISGHATFEAFALKTLEKMARGGIFDQIGGGFHRYSTDARWLVPHFEKMLYDNALIPINYAEAYQITKNMFFLDVMQKTLDFVLRDMTSPDGGFYSAYDADSEGVEGKYYTWKKQEILSILGNNADADLFCLYYDVTDGGNWEGETILCNNLALSTVAFKLGVSEEDAKSSLHVSCTKLLNERNKRLTPGLDTKILVSWNALFVSALVKGYRVSGNIAYLNAAKKCVSFIESKMIIDGKLLRTYKDGHAKIDAYLEDYAYFTCALLDLFEVESNVQYLQSAMKFGHILCDEFWDATKNCFYMTGNSHEQLITRPQNIYDLSVPSGNSVATYIMLRLYHLTGNNTYLDVCSASIHSVFRASAENPFAFGYMLNVMLMMFTGPREVTVLNPSPDIRNTIYQMYMPDSFVVSIDDAASLEMLSNTYLFFKGKIFDQKKTSVYVCKDSVCSLPMSNIDEICNKLQSSLFFKV